MKLTNRKKLYMLVTNDKYELPVCVRDTLRELAEAAGVKYHSLLCTKCRKSKIKVFGLWCKIVEVNLS